MSETLDYSEFRNAQLLKYLGIALAGGTAIGGGVSLGNFLRSLAERADETNTSPDEALTVDVPQRIPGLKDLVSVKDTTHNPEKKELEKSSAVEERQSLDAGDSALAVLAALGGAGASYYTIKNLYQNYKKKKLLDELESKQKLILGHEYAEKNIEGYDDEGNLKEASDKGNVFNDLTSAAAAVFLLASGAAGVGAYKLLDNHFPSVKPEEQKNLKPKEIVYRFPKKNESNSDENPNNGLEKATEEDQDVNFSQDTGITHAASVNRQYLLDTILQSQNAEKSGFPSLVNTIALGHAAELIDTGSIEGMFNKAASYTEQAAAIKKELAINFICGDEFFGTAIEPLLAAEILELSPLSVKAAEFIKKEDQEVFENFAEVIVGQSRQEMLEQLIPQELKTIKSASEIKTPSAQDLANLYLDLIHSDNINDQIQKWMN